MAVPVRWTWRLALTALWLLLTAWWLFLPTLGTGGESLDVPFVEISLFQTPSAVIISPTTDEAVPLRVLADMIAGLNARIADLQCKISQPLPPEFRNRGLIKILFGPPSPRRVWVYELNDASNDRLHAVQARKTALIAHLDSLFPLQTEVETTLPDSRGWARVCGPLLSFSQPSAPVLPGPVYVARTPLVILAALGLLPLLAGLVQTAIARTSRRRDAQTDPPAAPEAAASQAALAASAHGRHIKRPRWVPRLGVGLAVTIAGFLAARWATTDRIFQFQLRPADDLRFRVEHNCFLVGHFFDEDWRTKYIDDVRTALTSKRPAPMLPKVPKMFEFFQTRFWRYEPGNALRLVSQRALSRGVGFLQDGYQTVFAVGGWVAGLPGLLFLVPILTGLITEARMATRRRRGVCAACAYPMFGLPEPRCPECGTPMHPRKSTK